MKISVSKAATVKRAVLGEQRKFIDGMFRRVNDYGNWVGNTL